MGGGHYDVGVYEEEEVARVRDSRPVFHHDQAIREGRAERKVHPSLDPCGAIRESCDSKDHPNSTAIAILLDVTGSMSTIPKIIRDKIPGMMSLLTQNRLIPDPQILFGGIGDATKKDRAPLQLSQFESDNRIDACLQHLFLEEGGGGGGEESYQLALEFFAGNVPPACCTRADVERRRKGFVFIIGDERPYSSSTQDEILRILGRKVQEDVPVQDSVKNAGYYYHIFFILPNHTAYWGNEIHRKTWRDLLGEDHLILLEDAGAICETIGLTIGLVEGTVDSLQVGIQKLECSASTRIVVEHALSTLATNLNRRFP